MDVHCIYVRLVGAHDSTRLYDNCSLLINVADIHPTYLKKKKKKKKTQLRTG